MDNTVTVSIGLSENGEFKHPSNEVKIGNNTYNGWVYYYDYANYYEYRPISAYLKKDSLNNVFIGETYKDLKIYSLKRDNFIFKDCYYWDEISMGVNGWIEKFQSAKGTIEYPDKKYKGISVISFFQFATVSSAGVVTGVDYGTATITATCDGKTATCKVTVGEEPPVPPTPTPVVSVTLDKGSFCTFADTNT